MHTFYYKQLSLFNKGLFWSVYYCSKQQKVRAIIVASYNLNSMLHAVCTQLVIIIDLFINYSGINFIFLPMFK